MERNRLRGMRGLLVGLLVGLVLAASGVASAKKGGFGPSPEVVSLVTEEPDPTDACTPDGVEGESSEELPDLTSEGEESEGEESEAEEECPPVEEEEAVEHEPEVTSESGDEARQAECEEAAGLTDEPQPEVTSEGDEPEEGRSTGLDHAIEVVLANCIKNPQAPGLVNALRHLAENRDRKMARDEAKAERKAAKAAAKAVGKGHGKGH
jgi:hypothetical protein